MSPTLPAGSPPGLEGPQGIMSVRSILVVFYTGQTSVATYMPDVVHAHTNTHSTSNMYRERVHKVRAETAEKLRTRVTKDPRAVPPRAAP